jgi:hypothetical protein
MMVLWREGNISVSFSVMTAPVLDELCIRIVGFGGEDADSRLSGTKSLPWLSGPRIAPEALANDFHRRFLIRAILKSHGPKIPGQGLENSTLETATPGAPSRPQIDDRPESKKAEFGFPVAATAKPSRADLGLIL